MRNIMTIIDISLKVNVIIYPEKFLKCERNES